MKIVLDNIIFSLQRAGGISVLWTELIKEICKKAGWKISFIEYADAHENLFRRSLKLEPKTILANLPASLGRFGRYRNPTLSLEEKFIFCSSYYRFCRDRNAVNITIVHDFTYEYFRKGPAKWVNYIQKKRAIENSAGIICISAHTKKDLLHFHPHIDERKIRVIHNGVSEDFFKIQGLAGSDEITDQFKLPAGKKYLLFIGQRGGYKNFEIAVRACAALDKPDDYHLIIVGAKLAKKEKNFVDKLLGSDGYSVLTGVTNERLNMLYNIAVALIYPSAYEGFGIPVLESMRAGTPVIALNASSIPEVVGDAGILVDENPQQIAQRILELNNQTYYDEIVERGLRRYLDFSWEKTMKEYTQFFEDIFEKESSSFEEKTIVL